MDEFYSLKSEHSDTLRVYVIYEHKNGDKIVLYGTQYDLFTNNKQFLNIYYYPCGANITKKIQDKITKGYLLESYQVATIHADNLFDRNDNSVWKMNFLFNKLFSILHEMQANQKDAVDIIKNINQVSVMKFMHCEKGKLSEDNMKYMNEIYNKYRKNLI